MPRLVQGLPGPDEFIRLGTKIFGKKENIPASRARALFREFFGCDPEVANSIWTRICLKQKRSPAGLPRGSMPKHLLWALTFMKTYSIEAVLCRSFGISDKKTFQKWSKFYFARLQNWLWRR